MIIHVVTSAGIRPFDLLIISLLPRGYISFLTLILKMMFVNN